MKQKSLLMIVMTMVLGFAHNARAEGPVVVELFTSQSCSSCPPADKVLADLSENGDIIALGCHVTYWNHLHWEDTLSRQSCTDRQRQYSALMGKRRVYTPQMIVNGRDEFVGSKRRTARKAIEKAPAIKSISLSANKQGQITAKLPGIESGQYRLILFGTKNHHREDIKRGENRGRVVNYSNAVLLHQPIGVWSGQSKIKVVTYDNSIKADNLVVLAQSEKTGEIFAAGQLRL